MNEATHNEQPNAPRVEDLRPVEALSELERRLLDEFQRDFPLCSDPWRELGHRLGASEAEVLRTLRSLRERGLIARVGAVLRPNRVGASTLAAMAVPDERLEEVAAIVNSFTEVNHNYEREHRFNLWFVAGAPSEAVLLDTLREIETRTGLPVLYLPLVEDYHIDLGFRLQWN